MEEKELVTIIIPMYNAEKTIKKCIDSISKQDYSNLEIILIDDGSTDGTFDICKTISKEEKRIKLIRQENKGVSYARNTGIINSAGRFIMFLDSDDYIESNAISNLVENYAEETLDILKVTIVKNGEELLTRFSKDIISIDNFIERVLSKEFNGNIWGCLLDTAIVKKMNFDVNTSFMEDTLFLFEYCKYKKFIKYLESRYYYDITFESITRTLDIDRIKKNIIDINYTINKMEMNFQNKFKYQLINKRLELIESEMSKISDKEDLKMFLNEKDLVNIFNKCFGERIYLNSKNKMYLGILNKKNVNVLYLYNLIRRVLKKIYNRYKRRTRGT